MKKTLNRVVSFLLTLTMVFGLCCFPVSAVATDVNMSFVFTDTDFEVLTGPAKVGDIVFVGIKIDPYEPIKGFGWMFNYDPEVLAFDEEYKNKKQGFAEGYYSAAGYNVVNAETAGTIIVTGAGSKGNAVPAEDIADMENGCFIYFKFDVIGSGDAACEFNTAGQGNFEWSMIGEDEQTVSVVLPEEPTSLVCIKSGVSLSAATAVADSKNDITLTATAINADGENVTKNVSWSVSPAGVGVTVANDGTVTVGAKAAAGTYAVTATGSANAFGEAVATASAELQVTRNASAATQVVVTPATAEVARPYYNAQDNTASLTATVYDQYGAEMSVGVSWSGDLAVYNGKVTVTDATKAGIYTVTASRSGAFGSAVITVTEESAIAASLTLDKTADTVTVPAAGAAAATVSYTATVKDQYNRDMDTVIEWTLSGAPEGVTVDANGKVSVPAGIGNCSFTLQAKAGDCTATVAIKAVDLTFVNNGAVTVKADPTYGDTWAEIVTIDADKFTAKLGDATLSGGEYTLSVSGTPAVGTYTFDVLYSDSTYTDVVAYSGEVTVAAKTLTVVSDGVSMTKVYDATTDAGALSGDVTFTGKVGEDDVTLKVEKGTYADKNVGNKTVTLTLSLAGAKKDQYALSVNSVEIPASITVSDEVTATVSAAQNSVFGVGSFTAPAFSGIGGETVDGTLTYTYGGKDKTKDAIEAELQTLVKGDTAEIGYKFVASGNYEKTLTGTITVTMVDILFKVGDAEAMVENAVTVKADATYGDTWADIVTVSNQIKASVNGVAVDGTYSLSVSGTPDAGTQSYAVLFSASSGDKYQGVTVLESTVTVAPKSVAVTWSNTALTYNGAEQKPTATTEVADLAITVSGAQTDANIGNTKYTATASTANTNYALTNDSTEYTIAPMRVAVTWNNTALTYNGAEQKPTATTEVADLAITVSGAQTDASAEPYTAIALARNSNYTLTNAKTEYTIAPKSVAVTWSNTALTYNGTAQAPTAAAEGVNGALTLTVDGKTTDAGTGYTATASTADTNYSLTNAACTFDIAAKTLTVVSDGVSMTKVYDATTDAGALSGDVTFTGKVGEDDVTLKVEKGTYADKNVGNKTVTLTLSLAGAKKDQYALSVNSVEIPASITVSDEVTATVSAAQNSVFGVGSFTAPAFSGIGGETVDGTLTYTYGGKDKTKDAIEAELQTLVKGDTAEIGYKFVASGNYEKTLTGTITVTMVDILFKVGDAEAMVENAVTVKADATYGDTWADIVTVSNQIKASVNGVAVDGTYSLSVSGTPDAGTQSYAVLFSASSGDKYQGVTVLESTVTVAPKSVAVTWSNTALTYNGAEQKPTATTEVADLAITVSGAQTDANIGNTKYTATASTANTNYALTNDSTEYTIAPMRVAVTWNNTALTYNGAEQKPTATTEVADLAITVSGAQTDASAEPYTAIALARNSNYTLTNAKTEYTIAPKSVAVTWSNTALTYNGTAQAPTAAAEGVNGALTLTVDGKTTDAGTGYTATASTADTNYSLTNAACTFDIAAKSITVTIDAIAEQTFTGEAIEPTVTLRTDDLAEGDTLAKDADYTVSCTDNVNAGTASVTVKSTDGGNYTFADAFASFTIVPAAAPSLAVQGTTSFKYSVSGAQSVTISGVPANAGAVTYTVGTVTDAQDVLADTVTAADGVVTFTLSSMPAFVEGVTATIPVTVAMANYATAEVTITIIITDRDVPTVTAENITVTYTGTALTADSIRGTSSVAGTWSWVTDPATMVNAGSYTATVTFTPVDLVNYTDVDTTVVVTVDPAKVAVPAAAADLVYSGTEQVGVAGGALYTVEGGSATNAGSYTATVTLSDSANYAWATAFDGEITWTIAKAPSAGTPSYTKVKNSGKTLADAALAIGDITPVGGTIRWVDSEGNELPADTEIKANTAYTWLYTPADTNNYAELSDSVVLYKRNSSITLPFVGALGSGGTETYAVAVDQTIRNGVVTVSTAKASQGVTVTVTVTPNAGYTVQSVTVTTVSNKLIAVQKNADGSYSFAMPAVKVVVSAAFSDGKQNVFADVYTSDWYHASVYSAYGKGLMKGVSDTLFAPKSNFTRGMMMTALARLAGENTDGGTPWYAKGMAWATQQGISDGTNPESDITREQAVTMLYRYMGSPKVSENGLDSFTDSTATGDWAVDAMNWAISVGLLQGDAEGTIRPGDTATRAEIAALMVRFVDNVQ